MNHHPLTAKQHRALAAELDAIHRRLSDLTENLAVRYGGFSGPFALAADAVAALGWLEIELDDQFIRDDPENADHPYLASGLWPWAPKAPCQCELCSTQT